MEINTPRLKGYRLQGVSACSTVENFLFHNILYPLLHRVLCQKEKRNERQSSNMLLYHRFPPSIAFLHGLCRRTLLWRAGNRSRKDQGYQAGHYHQGGDHRLVWPTPELHQPQGV